MTVDEYLAGAPEPHRSTLSRLRSDLSALLPDATESLSYGMPAFKQGGKTIAGYAYFKAHCSYFPHSGSVLPEIADDLDGYEWTKGTPQVPRGPALADLIAAHAGQDPSRSARAQLSEVGSGSRKTSGMTRSVRD